MELANRFGEVPKSGRVVLYCDCKPYDVADRAVFLEYRGYRNIFSMPKGIKVGSNAATQRRPPSAEEDEWHYPDDASNKRVLESRACTSLTLSLKSMITAGALFIVIAFLFGSLYNFSAERI